MTDNEMREACRRKVIAAIEGQRSGESATTVEVDADYIIREVTRSLQSRQQVSAMSDKCAEIKVTVVEDYGDCGNDNGCSGWSSVEVLATDGVRTESAKQTSCFGVSEAECFEEVINKWAASRGYQTIEAPRASSPEEVERVNVECICGEINARHCPVHNEPTTPCTTCGKPMPDRGAHKQWCADCAGDASDMKSYRGET